jgi:hypothetical protein
MADFTQLISNTIECWGGKTAQRWGSMEWNTNVWAFGDGTLVKSVGKTLSNIITLTDAYFRVPVRVIRNTVTVTVDLSNQTLGDSDGYQYVFGDSTNAEDRPLTSFSVVAQQTSSYTTLVNTVTSWVNA